MESSDLVIWWGAASFIDSGRSVRDGRLRGLLLFLGALSITQIWRAHCRAKRGEAKVPAGTRKPKE